MRDMWLLLVLLLATALVLRSRGILTERVIIHPLIIPLFPGFNLSRYKRSFEVVLMPAPPKSLPALQSV